MRQDLEERAAKIGKIFAGLELLPFSERGEVYFNGRVVLIGPDFYFPKVGEESERTSHTGNFKIFLVKEKHSEHYRICSPSGDFSMNILGIGNWSFVFEDEGLRKQPVLKAPITNMQDYSEIKIYME